MSYSITITVDATGQVSVTATDRALGCSYHVASRHGGDLAGLDVASVKRALAKTLAMRDDFGWNALRPHVVAAVQEMSMCLPHQEDFDDEGRPVPSAVRVSRPTSDGEPREDER